VILHPVLLLVAGAAETVQPAIRIDPCVEVDAEEVRRLTANELVSWRSSIALTALDVAVDCEGTSQELRVTDRASGQVTVRSIDLSAPGSGDRDAKTRELALAIAELLRRVEAAAPPPAPPAPSPPPAVPVVPVDPTPPSEPRPWRAELGVSGAVVGYTGGEVLLGADVPGRIRLTRFVIADLRVGARKSRPIELESGTMNGYGVDAAAGLSLDATPGLRNVGVSFGGRLGASFLRYAAVDHEGATYGGKDAVVLYATGNTTAFVTLSEPLCLTLDAAIGGALHSIAIEVNGRSVSEASGILLSSAVGLAARF